MVKQNKVRKALPLEATAAHKGWFLPSRGFQATGGVNKMGRQTIRIWGLRAQMGISTKCSGRAGGGGRCGEVRKTLSQKIASKLKSDGVVGPSQVKGLG